MPAVHKSRKSRRENMLGETNAENEGNVRRKKERK